MSVRIVKVPDKHGLRVAPPVGTMGRQLARHEVAGGVD